MPPPSRHRSHTSLSTLARCQRKFHYGYVQRLKRRHPSLPITRGKWGHLCLQADAIRRGLERESLLSLPAEIRTDIDGLKVEVDCDEVCLRAIALEDTPRVIGEYTLSWRGMLALLRDTQWSWVPDEVRAALDVDELDLPEHLDLMLRGYERHYQPERRREEPLLAEYEGEVVVRGVTIRYVIDLITRDLRGAVVLRDHKFTKDMPTASTRLLEGQRMLYGLVANHDPRLQEILGGLKVTALEFDYVRTKVPTWPQRNQDGSLSKRKIATTAVRFLDALNAYGMDASKFRDQLTLLEQSNDFFFRHRMPYHGRVVKEILAEYLEWAELAQALEDGELRPKRSIDRSCEWACDFKELCTAELYGQDTSTIRQRDFVIRENEEDDEVIDLDDVPMEARV